MLIPTIVKNAARQPPARKLQHSLDKTPLIFAYAAVQNGDWRCCLAKFDFFTTSQRMSPLMKPSILSRWNEKRRNG